MSLSVEEKAKRYDELEPRLEDLVDRFGLADCLGSDDLHLIEQIASIVEVEIK